MYCKLTCCFVFFPISMSAWRETGGVAKSSIPPFDFEGWDHDIIFQSISDWQSRSLHRSLNQIQYKTKHCKTSPYSVKACNSNWMNETVNETVTVSSAYGWYDNQRSSSCCLSTEQLKSVNQCEHEEVMNFKMYSTAVRDDEWEELSPDIAALHRLRGLHQHMFHQRLNQR